MTGEAVEDMSDAADAMWLDIRAWNRSDAMLAASGLTRAHTPRLVEGPAPAGRMRADLATKLGFDAPPSSPEGAAAPGDVFLSRGTLGVAGRREAELLGGIDGERRIAVPVLFTPCPSGERTPYNDPRMRDAFARLDAGTSRAGKTQAVLESVAFAFHDGKLAMEGGGPRIETRMAIGGAFGGARLARLAAAGENAAAVRAAPETEVFAPDPARAEGYDRRYEDWRRLARFNRELEHAGRREKEGL